MHRTGRNALFVLILAVLKISGSQIMLGDGSVVTAPDSVPAPSEAYLLGIEAGVRVPELEVRARQHVLAVLAGGDTVSSERIRQDLVAEKFLLSQAPAKATTEELRVAWDTLRAHIPRGQNLDFTMAAPLLEARVVAEKLENRLAMERMISARRDKSLDSLIQTEEAVAKFGPPPTAAGAGAPMVDHQAVPLAQRSWTIRELQIKAPPFQCVVWDTIARACVLDVAGFNLRALTHTGTRDIPLDSIRKEIVDKALNVMFYASEAKNRGFDQRPDVQRRVGAAMGGFSDLDRQAAQAAALSDSVLYRVYQDNYTLFQEHEELKVRVTGTSDSAYLDSLSRSIAETAAPAKSPRGRAKLPLLPGTAIPGTALPDQILRALDSLPVGDISRPIHTPYGHFLVGLLEARTVPLKSFQDARQEVFALGLEGKIRTRSAISPLRIKDHYERNLKRYVVPDTFALRAWLFPGEYSAKRSKNGALDLTDTATRKPLTLTSLNLADTTRTLFDQARMVQRDSKILWFSDPFGTWVIQIAGTRKGGRQLPLQTVRQEIVKELQAQPAGWLVAPRNEREGLLASEAVALAYWQDKIRTIPDPSDDVVRSTMVDPKFSQVAPTSLPEEVRAQIAKSQFKEKIWRAEQESWKHGKILDTWLLRQ